VVGATTATLSFGRRLTDSVALQEVFIATMGRPAPTKDLEKYTLTYVEKNGYYIQPTRDLATNGQQDNIFMENAQIAQALKSASRKTVTGTVLLSLIAAQGKPLYA
jgi:hypothetical protein